MTGKRLYLIAEYCEGPFYMGWWLYLRESKKKNTLNSDGSWGWIRYSPSEHAWDRHSGHCLHPCRHVFNSLGIEGEIRGGCGDDGVIAQFALAKRLPRERVGKKPRGCVEVDVDEWGTITLAG